MECTGEWYFSGRRPTAIGTRPWLHFAIPVATEFTHLDELEAESIQILRETAASFERPVLMYSIGKDSTVLLHLAMKAFWPAKPPFPLLHVDTTWKFRDIITFRDDTAKRLAARADSTGATTWRDRTGGANRNAAWRIRRHRPPDGCA
jgi:3'-phosphoadenosine 5'-phosphosulfate sulfotransferase (PAPS reductase)/FAD synthetase